MAKQDKGVLLTPLRSVRSAQPTDLRRPGSPTPQLALLRGLTANLHSVPILALPLPLPGPDIAGSAHARLAPCRKQGTGQAGRAQAFLQEGHIEKMKGKGTAACLFLCTEACIQESRRHP